ncbi:MAG: DUF1549 domain-containing protein [Pirellulales bacterium]
MPILTAPIRSVLGCLFIVCVSALGAPLSLRSQDSTVADPLKWEQIPSGTSPTEVIDRALSAAWHEQNIAPAEPTTDAEFIRRVTLDLIGRVPKDSELESFAEDNDTINRTHLVERLLDSDEHAVHLSEVLDAIFIGRTEADGLKRRANAGWNDYLKESVRRNRPWNEVVRELIVARPTDETVRGSVWYVYSRKDKPQEIAEAVSKDIFGVRIDCAQCHDHPLSAEIEQKHYWGLTAFFNRSKNVDTPKGPRVTESAIGGFSNFSNLEGQAQPNRLVYFGDRAVDEPRPADGVKEEDKDELYTPGENGEPRVPKFSRRAQFADVILKDNPFVAKAAVNRFWCMMFGRGIVHPVDTLDSFHPASHPELLDWLAKDFAASGYNVRRLLQAIANTRAYQLKSTRPDFVDPKWFAVAEAKPLTAEALHRSMLTVLEPSDPGRWNTIEIRTAFNKLFPDVMAEESIANVAQGLMLTNGEAINSLASVKHSELLKRLSTIDDPSVLTDHLFQSVLGRLPDQEERDSMVQYLSRRSDRRDKALEQICWALLTGAEFRFNH